MNVDEARTRAMEVLAQCRRGERPSQCVHKAVPTLRAAYIDYCSAKGVKASSQKR